MSEERLLEEWEWQDRAEARQKAHRHLMDAGEHHSPEWFLPKKRHNYSYDRGAEEIRSYYTDKAFASGAAAVLAVEHGEAGRARFLAQEAAWYAHQAGVGRE
jgi:hypothetical protein